MSYQTKPTKSSNKQNHHKGYITRNEQMIKTVYIYDKIFSKLKP